MGAGSALSGGGRPATGDLRGGSLDHNEEEEVASVPATEPADAPAVEAITQGDGAMKAEELGLDQHGLRSTHSCLGRGPQSTGAEPSFAGELLTGCLLAEIS